MVTVDDVRRLASTLPRSEEHLIRDRVKFRVGRIVYVASTAQLVSWLDEMGVPPAPVRPLPIQDIAPGVTVVGPIPELVDDVHLLHRRLHQG